MDKYMDLAIKLATKAEKNGDVPVGAVIVNSDKVIAKAYNKKEKNKIATKHAEIIAIEKACKKIKDWRLNDCTLYVTMEPCIMCTGAIIQSRIKKIIYIVENPKFGVSKMLSDSEVCGKFNHKVEVEKLENYQNYAEKLNQFFKKIRDTK